MKTPSHSPFSRGCFLSRYTRGIGLSRYKGVLFGMIVRTISNGGETNSKFPTLLQYIRKTEADDGVGLFHNTFDSDYLRHRNLDI